MNIKITVMEEKFSETGEKAEDRTSQSNYDYLRKGHGV